MWVASVLAAWLVCAPGWAERATALNHCISKQTCSECIRTPSCGWCYDPDFPDQRRCFRSTAINATGACDEAFFYNPPTKMGTLDPEFDRELTKASRKGYEASAAEGGWDAGAAGAAAGAGRGNIVQVRPQRVKLSLRMNEAHTIDMHYSQAEDNPVDLYYLMDLSKSMQNDKEKLSTLGDLLADTMKKLTSNFRLGFGSFVDKTVMPYISTIPEKLVHPCEDCVAPYGYRNDMSLSTDTSHFSEAVKRANVSGNLDAPEGGFDAIMQSVVCPDIGWRSEARKLLVFSTDAGFHYAGDGKLGGIIVPNDGQCHLSNNEYVAGTTQDYPSISQINLKVKEKAINVIFAVTQEQISVYKRLEAHIEGSTSGVLSEDSSNVVDLVRENYDKITSNVEIRDNAQDSVKITYYSSCLDPNSPPKQTNKCEGLKVGQEVQFRIEIALLSCPADRSKWNPTIQIYPVGVGESLSVDLEMLCDCPCERPGIAIPHSPKCNGQGTYACGVCDCLPSHYGHFCECSASDNSVGKADSCRPPGTNETECSGRGVCNCGQCTCHVLPDPNEKITGTYCECDNFSCDRNNQQLCSGPEHGRCVCGHCECNPGWTGNDCSCRALDDTCMINGLVCNNRGTCECGVCVCEEKSADGNVYSGQYCSECRTCMHKCEEFKECVLCQHFHQGLSDAECAEVCHYNITPVATLTRDGEDEADSYICTYLDENDCRYSYKYTRTDNTVKDVYIQVQDKLECPPPVFILGIVLGVIAAIVLIGLALLMLWKMVTTIHDRREFARFEKERAAAKWDTGENPIYKQATSTFKNPTYQGK